jgi:hypothetical protein
MKTTQPDNQYEGLESLLNKDSKAFNESVDIDLQKQILAAVETEAKRVDYKKSATKRSLSWLFSGITLAAAASFLAITLVPQWVSEQKVETKVIPKFSINTELHKVGKNIEKAEVASISKMTTEQQAIKKDIKNILNAFSIGK